LGADARRWAGGENRHSTVQRVMLNLIGRKTPYPYADEQGLGICKGVKGYMEYIII
jgi:hypothetical protein